MGITDGRLNSGGTGRGAGEGDWVISDEARADLTVVRAEQKPGAAREMMCVSSETNGKAWPPSLFSRRNHAVQNQINGHVAKAALIRAQRRRVFYPAVFLSMGYGAVSISLTA